MNARTLVVSAIAVLAALVPAAVAQAAFPQHARVSRDAATGSVQFVGTPAGRPIPRPAGHAPASPPASAARAFLRDNARAFGLGRNASVRAVSSSPQPKGATAVRFQQSLSGVEVIGGQFVVQVDADNNILSALGEFLAEEPIDTTAALSAADAERHARARVAREEGVNPSALDARADGLRVFDERLMDGPGIGRPVLTWAVEVGDGAAVRRLVLVDATLGAITRSIDRNPEAKQRSVCDAANTSGHYPCTAPVLVEGGAYAGGVADVQLAYDYAGATYDYFQTRFGRDSMDGAGMPLKSTVRYCQSSCPYANAFWDGRQMVYGPGYASADDVVGHELAHGLTEFSSHLFYSYQSGAINESMSDVFGEIVDLLTDSPNDAAGDRWKLGESLPTGAIRNMADPGQFSDPDSMTSSNYYAGTGDNGGVHGNSGVGNKAAFLIADGGAHNGETVAGLGLEKMGRLFYAVNTGFLTSASDYKDLGHALGQACQNLVGSSGFTTDDCVQVGRAVGATRMLTERPEATDAPECTANSPAYVFADDLEGPARWTASGRWYLPQNTHPYTGFDATYATSGSTNMWGDDYGAIGDYSIEQNTGVTVPADGFLSFQHAHLFEAGGSSYYDGGVVELQIQSPGGVPAWVDIGSSAYQGTLSSSYGNPLGGRRAFVGSSSGYRRTVLSLAEFAGQTVRVRFRIGTDSSTSDYGWFIDDIRIGACVPPPQAATGTATDVTASTATLHGSVDPNGAATSYQFEYGATPSLGSVAPAAPASAGAGQDPVAVSEAISGLSADTTYHFRVVAVRGSERTPGPTMTFTTGAAPAAPATQPAATDTAPAGGVSGSGSGTTSAPSTAAAPPGAGPAAPPTTAELASLSRGAVTAATRTWSRALRRLGLGGMLRSGARLAFAAPAAGRLTVSLTAAVRKRGRSRRVRIATASRSRRAAGRAVVRLRLTKAGRRLAKRSRRLRVTLTATFRATGEPAHSRRATFTMTRRPAKRGR